MSLLEIVCHPFDRSFTHSLANRVEQAATPVVPVIRHNLYAEDFDPVLSGAEIARRFSSDDQVQNYSRELEAASGYLFLHPDWWSGPPALLKGWIDRVMRPGVAYDWVGDEFEEKTHKPLLTGRLALVFVTTESVSGEGPEAISAFWREVCAYSGIGLQAVHTYADLRHSSMRQRRTWLDEAESTVTEFARTIAQGGIE